MTTTSSIPSSPKRRLLPWALGGCALLALCVLFACTADAVYWTYRNRGAARELSADEIRAAVASLPPGEAARGERIFTVGQPCHNCHLEARVGPQFSGEPALATLAAARRPGYSAEAYLYESIINPRAYVVTGYQANVMPNNFGEILSEQELADLLAYLMTMK